MGIVYSYNGPNLRGIKKEIRKSLDLSLKNHRARFMPFHFSPVAFNRYPLQYQKTTSRSDRHRAAAIKLRFDTTPPEQWAELRNTIVEESQERRGNPNRLLPLVDKGLMRQMVLLQHAQFQGSLNARRMVITVPFYINTPTGILNKRAALEVIREDEARAFAKVTDRSIQRFANKMTLRR